MKRLWLNLIALAALTACTVHPLTPTPEAGRTLPPAAIAVTTFTPTVTPPPTETDVPTATVAVTAVPTPTPAPTETARPALVVDRPAAPATAVSAAPKPLSAVPEPTQTGGEAALPPAVEATQPPPAPTQPPAAGDVAAAEQYTIDLINAQRAAAGVAPLARDETLMSIARGRVADMIARGYTGHTDPATGAPLARQAMQAAGYTSAFLGENWYGSIKPPPGIVEIAMSWFMIDPPHARNILSPNYVAVGVGLGYNGRQWLLIQNFAGPNP